MKKFYRVCSPETQQGLWYDFTGTFTGLIHGKFDFCLHKELKMDFDPELAGYLSAAGSLEGLYKWFPMEDIARLQDHGFFVHEYEADDYFFYDRFQHFVINQKNSKLVKRINMEELCV